MGAKYYARLKEAFELEASPQKQLKVNDETESIKPMLLKAIVSSKAKQPNRQPMMGYLHMAEKPNQKELVGILRWGLELKPSTSSEQLRCCLDLMRWCARLELYKDFPDEIKLMKAQFDKTLVEAPAPILNLKQWGADPPQPQRI